VDEEDFIYPYTSLTSKGIIASSISECNPILLTEMITEGYFDKLNLAEIMGVLAVFINER